MSIQLTADPFPRYPDQRFENVAAASFDASVFMDLYRGKITACLFRQVVPPAVCQEIVRRFEQSSAACSRTDGLPGFRIGTAHYDRQLADYLVDVAQTRASFEALFVGLSLHPLLHVNNLIASALQSFGVTAFRTAQHDGMQAGECLVRTWPKETESGTYTSKPHEDLSQLYDPKQRAFEIQAVSGAVLMGLNICLRNGQGGALEVWRARPPESPQKIQNWGYPYPSESLEGKDSLLMQPRPGDVYALDARWIHAVQLLDLSDQQRINIGYFVGQLNDTTAIRWS